MQTNKQTIDIIDETKRSTRREMFQLFNILPWLLLVVVLGCTTLYFYKQKSPTNPPVISTNITAQIEAPIVPPIDLGNEPQILFEDVVETRQIRESLTPIEVPSQPHSQPIPPVQPIFTNVFTNVVIDIRGFRDGVSRMEELVILYRMMFHDFSNVVYTLDKREVERVVRQTGLRGQSLQSGQSGNLSVNSGNSVFTASDMITAERLRYDLENEIINQNLAIIEIEFGNWDGTEAGVYTIRDNLRMGIRDSVKRNFEGFKTYNKINGR